ncbi:hypothetical protein RRG08_046233 [Elysia crispata]|uniref:Uncharacterized protein n=1 Tax=Elysia crispata TaxID=231223 RepID=A0AAE0YVK6_9GAST|nr:hypothetical protein RRG08_046233 [Elysia crispata]
MPCWKRLPHTISFQLLGIVKLFGIIDRSVMPAHLDLPLLDSIVLPQQFSVPACRGLEMLGNRDPRALAFIGTIHLPALPVGQQAFGSFALDGVFVQPAPLHVAYAAEVQVLPTLPVLPMQIPGLVQEAPVFPGAAMLPQASYVNPHLQPPIEILARTFHDPYDLVSGSGDSVQASTSIQTTASDSNLHQCRSRKQEDREVIVIENSSEEVAVILRTISGRMM